MRTKALAIVMAATCAMSVSGAAPGLPPSSEASQARAQVLRVKALRGVTSPAPAVMPVRPEQEKRSEAVPTPEKPARAAEAPRLEEAAPAADEDAPTGKKRIKNRFLPQRPRATPMPASGRVLKPQAVNPGADAPAAEASAAPAAKVRPQMAKPTVLKPLNVKAKRSIRLPNSVQTGPVSSAESPL